MVPEGSLVGFRVSDFGFRVSGFGFRVSGFGFRVRGEWYLKAVCLTDFLILFGQQTEYMSSSTCSTNTMDTVTHSRAHTQREREREIM